MNTRSLKVLAVLVLVLFVAVFALNRPANDDGERNELLFPDLKDRLDEVSEVTIADAGGAVTITRTEEGWVVPDKGGYEANTGALRELLLAIAEARTIEQKTSNSELYERLGVEDPMGEGSNGVLVESAGLGTDDFALILGDPVQGEYRYVRLADAKESWLIDRNPEIPADAGGWLAADIVDIPSSSVRSVTITHPDGEAIRIRKADPEAANFEVDGIPEDRELSYPSVANGVAAALASLTLEDVRASATAGGVDATAAAATTTTRTVFTTFDGLRIAVESSTGSTGQDPAGKEAGEDGDAVPEAETWITLAASVVPDAGVEGPQGDEDAVEPDVQEGDAGSTSGNEDEALPDVQDAPQAASGESGGAAPAETEEMEAEADPTERAAAINARVAGWEYRIPTYKASQLTRRWEDLLKAEE